MRIVLLGLTGYTNEVLPAILADERLKLCAVFTRRYDAPFPYYPIPQVHEMCAGLDIPCHTNLRVTSGTGFELLRSCEPDLILMTGFNQILTRPVLDLPRLGAVNMHPSLLPKFRGADPIQAVLLDEATETGVTFHYAVPEVDAGNILVQARYRISPDETNASLRLELARLAASHLPRVIDLFADESRPAGTPQRGTPTPANRRFAERVSLDQTQDLRELHKVVRAVAPYPGVTVNLRGIDRIVRSSTFIEQTLLTGNDNGAIDEEGFVVLERSGGRLVLTLAMDENQRGRRET
ncbi:methionyl-tRNA formyltransferase [Mycobacterium sp. TY815]|uniref:methionyl-tRNA formyltransferase n=1 Tax=Mycobacterium sp. TY815 TaxID=3050581 RepID=UPI002741D2E9|nr:formyltransferase family protein [Mycobacterium sp. TY815]MDP7702397.1 formyltransferase family protein [Mycobacterium sp. TY815]